MFYVLYVPIQTRVSLPIDLRVRLFVYFSVEVCLFVCFFVFYSIATETQICLLSAMSCISEKQIRTSVEGLPWRAWRPTSPRWSSRTGLSSPAGTRSRFKSRKTSCASAFLSSRARPYWKYFKERPSHHLR